MGIISALGALTEGVDSLAGLGLRGAKGVGKGLMSGMSSAGGMGAHIGGTLGLGGIGAIGGGAYNMMQYDPSKDENLGATPFAGYARAAAVGAIGGAATGIGLQMGDYGLRGVGRSLMSPEALKLRNQAKEGTPRTLFGALRKGFQTVAGGDVENFDAYTDSITSNVLRMTPTSRAAHQKQAVSRAKGLDDKRKNVADTVRNLGERKQAASKRIADIDEQTKGSPAVAGQPAIPNRRLYKASDLDIQDEDNVRKMAGELPQREAALKAERDAERAGRKRFKELDKNASRSAAEEQEYQGLKTNVVDKQSRREELFAKRARKETLTQSEQSEIDAFEKSRSDVNASKKAQKQVEEVDARRKEVVDRAQAGDNIQILDDKDYDAVVGQRDALKADAEKLTKALDPSDPSNLPGGQKIFPKSTEAGLRNELELAQNELRRLTGDLEGGVPEIKAKAAVSAKAIPGQGKGGAKELPRRSAYDAEHKKALDAKEKEANEAEAAIRRREKEVGKLRNKGTLTQEDQDEINRLEVTQADRDAAKQARDEAKVLRDEKGMPTEEQILKMDLSDNAQGLPTPFREHAERVVGRKQASDAIPELDKQISMGQEELVKIDKEIAANKAFAEDPEARAMNKAFASTKKVKEMGNMEQGVLNFTGSLLTDAGRMGAGMVGMAAGAPIYLSRFAMQTYQTDVLNPYQERKALDISANARYKQLRGMDSSQMSSAELEERDALAKAGYFGRVGKNVNRSYEFDPSKPGMSMPLDKDGNPTGTAINPLVSRSGVTAGLIGFGGAGAIGSTVMAGAQASGYGGPADHPLNILGQRTDYAISAEAQMQADAAERVRMTNPEMIGLNDTEEFYFQNQSLRPQKSRSRPGMYNDDGNLTLALSALRRS